VLAGEGTASRKWAGLTWCLLGTLPYWAVFAWPFGALGVLVAWAALAAATERAEEKE
jgi:hypothetical protein